MKQFIEDEISGLHAFIQWKGTDVCMDFHCECGAHCHFDGYFAYCVKCPHCEQVWQMPIYMVPRKATPENAPWHYDSAVLLEPDEEMPTHTTEKKEGSEK